jgi:hypothetical protein
MGPNLVVITPFGNIDPTLAFAQGGVSTATSIEDAADMIEQCFSGEERSSVKLVAPKPSDCARILMAQHKLRSGQQGSRMMENMFCDYVTSWSSWTLQAFALAASKPELFDVAGVSAPSDERSISLEELSNSSPSASAIVRIAMLMDGDRPHYIKQPDFLFVEKVEPVINRDGQLDLFFHRMDGGLSITPVKILCSSFYPDVAARDTHRQMA